MYFVRGGDVVGVCEVQSFGEFGFEVLELQCERKQQHKDIILVVELDFDFGGLLGAFRVGGVSGGAVGGTGARSCVVFEVVHEVC